MTGGSRGGEGVIRTATPAAIEKVRLELAAWRQQGGDVARLLDQKRWVCYNLQPKTGGGFSKPPIDPNTGRRIDIRTEEGKKNLLTAQHAYAALANGQCDGIGIATGVFDGLSLVGIDVDNCLDEDGLPIEEWKEVIYRLATTGYLEISQSGRGVRAFVLGEKPQGCATRRGSVEVYDDGQYCTLTGKILFVNDQIPLNDDVTALNYICEKYLKLEPERAIPQRETTEQDTGDIIDRALQHDGVFSSLWNGDRPNGNESSDDLALMNKLAYWLDQDTTAMIDAFLRSPHAMSKDADHIKKMQRKDYLPNTAAKAARECARTRADDDEQYQAGQMKKARETLKGQAQEKQKKGVEVTSANDIPYEDPRWLIAPYLQIGKGNMFQGDNGTGKTAFLCYLIAHVTSGEPILVHSVQEPGNVLILSVEDDPPILRGRIEACGGDLNKCFFVENAANLSFLSPEIEEAIKKVNARMIVFDPLQAFLGAGVDMHRGNETRPIFAKLFAMANRNNCAVAIVAHTGKDSRGKASVNLALGSVDIPAAMRSIMHLARNPEDESEVVAVHIKCSNAPKGRSIAFEIGYRGGVTVRGYSPIGVKELQAIEKRKERAIDYDSEPLVQVFRQLITDRPGGGFWSYAALKETGMKILGFPPFSTIGDLKSKLDTPFAKELQERDGIIVTCGHQSSSARGIRIEQFTPQREYQTSMREKSDAMS